MASTAHQPVLVARSKTMPLGTPCAVHQSPLLGQRSPAQGNRMFLGDVGAFLSRTSPRLASRTLPQTGLTQVIGTRGGVVRNQDGFEAFYGVGKAALPAKPQKNKASERDGFDVFYGIRTRDRTKDVRQAPMQMSARSPASSSAPDVKLQQRQVESQLQARLAGPVPSPDQTSRFVPVGRSVSDSVMLHYACGYEATDLTTAQAAQADVPSIPAVREEGEEDEDERREPVEHVNLGDEPSAPNLSRSTLLTRQAKLVKGVEVFSMSGRPTPGLLPAGVVAFDLATPTPSFEPPHATWACCQ